MANRFEEHLHDGRMQAQSAFAAYPARSGARVNARAEQCLVGIDISDSADHALIEKYGLDRRVSA